MPLSEGGSDRQTPTAASEHDDEGWKLTREYVDPQDPIIAGPRWRDALREIAEHDYLDGDECRRIAREALA